MEYQNILFEIRNKIAFVTINRPDKLNALNGATLNELKDCFTAIKNNNEVNVTIITGAGEKAFVAGADISELNKLNTVAGKIFAENGQEVFNLIEKLGKLCNCSNKWFCAWRRLRISISVSYPDC